MSSPVLRPAGAAAVMADFGDVFDDDVYAQVVALDQAIQAAPPAGLCETVPAYTSLLIVFNPILTDHETVSRHVLRLPATPKRRAAGSKLHEVPVCYDGDAAPDLAAAALQLKIAPDTLVKAHLEAEYRVYMYGFAPGYAYLGGVPERVHLPRKAAAVRGYPVGSVMVAGAQCLITTLPMPTGWWVIGRTPLRVLDPTADRPFLFDPGDRVRFTRVGAEALA
ncbi:carboxyltransferase domain-containing protein [Sphingomonas sp.]|jgi:inhibitor of KinA|uniref:5-oxoprolinase subunit B family protein n=1 Tax=Sphingomonas sp. TaxID=28214 RepID=UPI002639B99F|nr:carboxyltransferase domain-containing protein [Sphingomonas sp.]MDF2494161.1 allophanate hydrolase subunit 1 [Sphingomonas sp.]